jgi:hypothetical protein
MREIGVPEVKIYAKVPQLLSGRAGFESTEIESCHCLNFRLHEKKLSI